MTTTKYYLHRDHGNWFDSVDFDTLEELVDYLYETSREEVARVRACDTPCTLEEWGIDEYGDDVELKVEPIDISHILHRVWTYQGQVLDMETVAHYMDRDLAEDLHFELAPCEPQDFYEEYCKRHKERFDEEFRID
uniref:AcrIC5-like domain-containing protein n=1 Tax=uncultured bacterium Contig1770 TaxID=1393510 RepID=W0FHS3_9BACT|nr:hypothetical protein [uncultured bacterium Contig1770]